MPWQADLGGVLVKEARSSPNKEEVGCGRGHGGWGLRREGAESGETREQGYIADGGERQCLARDFKLF